MCVALSSDSLSRFSLLGPDGCVCFSPTVSLWVFLFCVGCVRVSSAAVTERMCFHHCLKRKLNIFHLKNLTMDTSTSTGRIGDHWRRSLVCVCVSVQIGKHFSKLFGGGGGAQLLFSRVSESAGNGHRERERQLFLIKKENSLFLLKWSNARVREREREGNEFLRHTVCPVWPILGGLTIDSLSPSAICCVRVDWPFPPSLIVL